MNAGQDLVAYFFQTSWRVELLCGFSGWNRITQQVSDGLFGPSFKSRRPEGGAETAAGTNFRTFLFDALLPSAIQTVGPISFGTSAMYSVDGGPEQRYRKQRGQSMRNTYERLMLVQMIRWSRQRSGSSGISRVPSGGRSCRES